MASIEKLLDFLVSECRKIKAMNPEAQQDAWGGGLPCTLPLGGGWQIATTRDGLRAFNDVMRAVRSNSPDLADAMSRPAFERMCKQAIGKALDAADWSLSADRMAKAVKRTFREELDSHRRRVERSMTHHIPVDLFEDGRTPAFSVGPVTFRLREDWLEAVCADRRWKELVEAIWTGRILADHIREAEAALELNSEDSIDLHEVLAAIGRGRWIASVAVTNCEPERSRQKASVVVGLALDAVGLCFHPDDAKLTGPTDESRTPVSQQRLSQDAEDGFMHASRLNLPGIRGRHGFATAVVVEKTEFFEYAGRLLARFLEPTRPPLAERWCNALYWHSQALREPADFMAVVKHGVALYQDSWIMTDAPNRAIRWT